MPHATNILGGSSAELLKGTLESRFKNWLVEHGSAVLKVARAYTLTAEECQDLVQEILLEVWRSLPQFQWRVRTSTWCYRVALNTALDWRRKEHGRRTRQRPILEFDLASPADPDGAQQLVQSELVDRLYAAVRQLPKTDAALILLYLDDLTYREMADVLGISEGNVGVKLNRAKSALAKLMKDDCHESE